MRKLILTMLILLILASFLVLLFGGKPQKVSTPAIPASEVAAEQQWLATNVSRLTPVHITARFVGLEEAATNKPTNKLGQ